MPPWRATSPGDFSMPTDADAVFFANASQSQGQAFGADAPDPGKVWDFIIQGVDTTFKGIGTVLTAANNKPAGGSSAAPIVYVAPPPPPPPPTDPVETPWYKKSAIMLPVGVGALVLAAGAAVYNARAQGAGGRAYSGMGMRAFGGNRALSDFGPMNPSDPALSTDDLDCGCGN